jgi:hypothetical protein
MHVTAEGRVWFVPPTRAVWIPHNVTHEIGVRGEVALRTLYIKRAGGARNLAATLRSGWTRKHVAIPRLGGLFHEAGIG